MNYCRNEFLRGLCLTLIRIKFVKTQDKFSSSHYPPPRRIVTLSIRWPGFGSPDTLLSQRARSLPGNPWALKYMIPLYLMFPDGDLICKIIDKKE